MHRQVWPARLSGCASLFGLPFLAGGLVVLVLVGRAWILHFSSADWVAVPAEVLSAELQTNSDSDGDTYRVLCRYRYEFNGKTWEGDRVGLQSFASSEYRFHRRLFDGLDRARQRGEPVQAWVNPKDPASSLLSREVDTFMIVMVPFGLVFVLVGGGLTLAVLLGRRQEAARREALERFPDRPWKAEGTWERCAVEASTRTRVLGAWGAGLFLALFLSIFLIPLGSEPGVPFFAWVIVGIFCLLDFTILGGAVYATLQHAKYGTPRLLLAQVPFVPGNALVAQLLVDRPLDPEQAIECTLSCSRTTGSGDDASTSVIHKDVAKIDRSTCDFHAHGAVIPIAFKLPESVPPRKEEPEDRIRWSLAIVAATPGVDFGATFDDLPVYAVSDPSAVEYPPKADHR